MNNNSLFSNTEVMCFNFLFSAQACTAKKTVTDCLKNCFFTQETQCCWQSLVLQTGSRAWFGTNVTLIKSAYSLRFFSCSLMACLHVFLVVETNISKYSSSCLSEKRTDTAIYSRCIMSCFLLDVYKDTTISWRWKWRLILIQPYIVPMELDDAKLYFVTVIKLLH